MAEEMRALQEAHQQDMHQQKQQQLELRSEIENMKAQLSRLQLQVVQQQEGEEQGVAQGQREQRHLRMN